MKKAWEEELESTLIRANRHINECWKIIEKGERFAFVCLITGIAAGVLIGIALTTIF